MARMDKDPKNPAKSPAQADTTPAATPAGPQRQHAVRDRDGTVRRFSDDEWIARDRSAGLVRIDDDGAELADDEADTHREPGVKTRSDLDGDGNGGG